MLVSGVQQIVQQIYMYLFLFQIHFLIRVLQNIEQSSLCFTVGPCWLSILSVKVKLLSHVQFFATPWTVAYQAPPSMGFSRQEYWSGLPFSIVVCKCNKEEEIYLQHCNFTSSVYKINPSVYTYIYISCRIQNIVYITYIANTRHQKRKVKVKRDWYLVITIYILIMKKQQYNCLKVS